MRRALAAFILLAALSGSASAFTDDEHRHLTRHAFEQILPSFDVAITAENLAEIAALSSREDMSSARFHVRGKTPHEQAAVISPEQLQEIVAGVIENPPTENAFAPYADNVAANYLVYHTLALRCAVKSRSDWEVTAPPQRTLPDRSEWVERAFVFEAVALGYLADAYSSSHMLTPVHLPLGALQDANVRAAHEFFATQGAYVYCQGEVWQTFGDGLLRWHGPAYDRVVKACDQSAFEVAQVLNPKRPGPASLHSTTGNVDVIPSVIVATWRFAGESHPQFREEGFHDPDLQVDRRFLYSRSAFPPIYVPVAFEQIESPIDRMRRDDPKLASVEYHQTLDVPPAFAGLLLMTGGGVLLREDGGGGMGSVAAGYGWEFVMPLVQRLRTSLELEYLYRLGDVDRQVIAPRYALGLGAPVVPLVESMHFEVGFAWGLNSPFKDQGVKWGVGIGTKPLRFPFTYAGVSARIKYERFWMDEVLDGFQLQLVFR